MKRGVMAAIAAVVVVAVGIGGYVVARDSDGAGGTSASVVRDLELSYPAGWEDQSLTEVDRKAGLIARADHTDPEATFLARTVVARLADDVNVNELGDVTEKALASGVEGFILLSRESDTIDGRDVVRILYRQEVAEQPVSHTMMVIVPTSRQTLYLTVRAGEDDFRAVQSDANTLIERSIASLGS